MALRKPLVVIAGQVTQLSASDTLDAYIDEVELSSAQNSNASSMVIGNCVYVDGAATMDLAQADSASTSVLYGFVRDTTILTTATGGVQTEGIFTATTTQWDAVSDETGGLDAGDIYYISPDTAGEITAVATTTATELVAEVGIALSTTELQILHNQSVLL
ncbi:MAG: hypothetical protein JRE40_15265 [Deltaproteobacteria bacterium]|nr:hypothetical protein [Deltaproteobacteria bacterium]